ncbi:unnamed protein product [Schistosoma mattheei]|uniref:G-protein coupled receptors family 1 profile domain-containing protein n=2 Tax=Schistosoma mattheei TaxID=31246 RepID=A0AA85AZL8_9TREM|nr:unnamed protein product [Schistosoma mattheei]
MKMIEDICSNSKLFLSKSLDFILTTNSQLFESNTNRMNHYLNKHDNSSLLFLNEYIKNVTEKLKGIQRFKQQLYICNIINLLWMYIPPIIFILGSLGNILSFVILRHSSTGSMTIFVYLIARSIVDEIVLIIGLLRRWFDKIFDTKFENTSNFMCKMIHFWGTSSSLLSVWLTVSLTAERALVVSFPLHVSRLISYNRVRNLIIILSILCAILSLHFCFTVGITSNCSHKFSKPSSSSSSSWLTTNQTIQMNLTIPFINYNTKIKCFEQCSILPQYSSLNWYWSSFDAILYSYLPFCLIFTFNIIILKSVYDANKQRKQLHILHNSIFKSSKNQLLLSSSSTSSSFIKTKSIINQKNKQINNINDNIKQLTIILLIISFSFLFTTFTIVFIKLLAQNLNLNDKNKLNIRIYLRLIDTIAELFMYINHAMNFYLFCATGKTFRKRLFSLLLLLFNQCKYNKFNFNQNNYCFSCLLLYFTHSNNQLNTNKQSNENDINQMKPMNKMNYNDVTIIFDSQNINLCNRTQMNEIPSIEDKNTTMELISYRLSTSLINNSCHIYMNHNIEDNYDSDTINNNNNTCLDKSKNKLCNESNEQLSSIIKHFSEIESIPNQLYYDRRKLCHHYHHHHHRQQQEHIGRNFSFDENQHNIEDNESSYSKSESYKRQTSTESLQTI